MGIRDSFTKSFKVGLEEGYNPQVRDGRQDVSPQGIQPYMVRVIGEQLRSICNGCENSQRGLGEGVLAEGGKVAVFSCVKNRAGDCKIIDGASDSVDNSSRVSITAADVSIRGAFGTVVSISYRK